MKNLILKSLITVLTLQVYFFANPVAVHAQEETCPPPTQVVIDVRPGSDTNKINLSANGLLPVAVLSTSDFDATQFAPEMAHLSDATSPMGCEGAEAVRWTYTDVNGDGLVDLVFFFRIQDLNLIASTTEVMLMGHGTYNGTMIHIEGADTVTVKP
jgi:hypothetical protein